MKANDLRPGMAVRLDGKLFIVKEFMHIAPGNWRAMVQLKVKAIPSGEIIERRLRSTEDVETVMLEKREMEYLYSDATGHVFMDHQTYDQVTVSDALIGDLIKFVKPNTTVTVLMVEGAIVSVELPKVVDLKVIETPPGIKGATVTNVGKEAILETGLKVRVPDFIKVGEVVRISTETGEYISRV